MAKLNHSIYEIMCLFPLRMVIPFFFFLYEILLIQYVIPLPQLPIFVLHFLYTIL